MVECDRGWSESLLPHLVGVVVEQVEQVEQVRSGVLIRARVKPEDGTCPSCGERSRRVHSRYDRRLADASFAGQSLILRLQVHRFFCAGQDCPVSTFAEQVDGLTVKHVRRTSLCRNVLEHIRMALADRSGSRLADQLGLVAGRSTLPRLVHALPDPDVGTVEQTEELRGHVSEVLARMGLVLSSAKTQIVHSAEGFDFLGFRIRWMWKQGTEKWHVHTFIGDKPVASLKRKIKALTQRLSYLDYKIALIRINQILRGWANYFKHAVAKHTMQSLHTLSGGG
jgi:hypothetical protein